MTDRNSAGYKVDNYLPEYIIKISDKIGNCETREARS